MTDVDTQTPVATVATDLQDERLHQGHGLRGELSSLVNRVRGGDLGILPVVAGLIVIAIVFNSLNSIFLSSANLSNLLLESVPVGVIALGIVCVLLVAEIDLSVGSVSGLSAALLAVLWVDRGVPVAVAVAIALVVGATIGLIYSQLFNRVGVPSFVITLAGLLAFVGVQLWLLGTKGAVNLPFDSQLVKFTQLYFVPKWLSYLLVVVAAGGLFATSYARAQERRKAGLSAQSVTVLAVRSAALLVGLGLFVWYLNQTRGVGWMFVFFVALVLVMHYVLTRTKFGRSMFAVGGNPEAARRAGINVKRVYTYVFVLCSSLAALGGVLAAARLAAANQSSGGADVNLNAIAAAVIGGTSLFGGRGSAFAALLGILVIQSISNGLTLLSLDSSYRFMITGGVLLLAVSLDSIARRSRVSHGRA
jgi:simple sugar transport system permease protein/D-xylose transport system permease protein